MVSENILIIDNLIIPVFMKQKGVSLLKVKKKRRWSYKRWHIGEAVNAVPYRSFCPRRHCNSRGDKERTWFDMDVMLVLIDYIPDKANSMLSIFLQEKI